MEPVFKNPGPERCWCATCRPVTFGDMRMVLCPVCGNKRCPRASNHAYACTGSNEVGQVGVDVADMAHRAPQCLINGANMTQEEIEAIARRPTCCKPFGEAVTLSRAERDALVAMARDGMRLGEVIDRLLAHCPDGECPTCGEAVCPHSSGLHFHHDGCPACAEHEATAKEGT